ncbi:MAG: hypothetical protein PVH87_09610 [Desulfobacteraceae bacterium]|jgi:hypothetical protein
MAGKLDWIVGDYYIYRYEDEDGPIVGYPCSYSKAGNGRIIVNWNYGADFEYKGTTSMVGGNLNVLSRRVNHSEAVLTIFPKPNTEYINLLWGVSVGTISRGNKPAAFRVLKSRKQLSDKEVENEFAEAGVNHQNGIFVIDYNIEEKNRRYDNINNLEDITQILLSRSPKAKELLNRAKQIQSNE